VLVGLGFIAVVAVSLSAISYTVGLLTKSEDVLAPAINMVVVPLMLLPGIMLPMTLARSCARTPEAARRAARAGR
jgi:ABC-2 type transport system permease protein